MDTLLFIKNMIVCLALLLMPIDLLASPQRTLFKAQKKIEETLIKEDIKKFYWEDSELEILMESKWWKKFPCSKNDTIIEGYTAINKSYPTFFEDFKALGGIANVITDR